jgi:hypothetical protein
MLYRVWAATVVSEHSADDADVPAARIGSKFPVVFLEPSLKVVEDNTYSGTHSLIIDLADIFEMVRKIENHRFADGIS